MIFGVDDGPKDLEASLSLAEASIAEGVTHVVATPHANDRFAFDPQINQERLFVLQERIGDRLTLGLGCDFHLSYENIIDLESNCQKYTINGTQYLLVEFSDFGIRAGVDDLFNRMMASGLVPIITHPERNAVLMKDSERLDPWIYMGCLVQVTAASLDGRFGQKCQSVAFDLVRKNRAHVVASDAHSIAGRPAAMARAFSLIEERFGRDTAARLCIENPAAIFRGDPIPFFRVVGESFGNRSARRSAFWRRKSGRR